MELIYNHDEKNWDAFVLQNSKSFLQSFAWGNFQQSNSGKVFRLCVQKNGQTLVQTQIVKESFSFKKYFYIPFGPIFKNGIESKRKSEALKFLLDSIKELAKEEDCVFLRIEPFEELGEINGYMVNKSLRRMQPRKTLIMDLQKSEEELLKEFKPKTRQNINFARKSGIEIKKNKQNFEDFYKLM